MYTNEILNNLFALTSSKETIVLNMPFVSSFVPNVTDDSVYDDAVHKTFDFVSSMKLDDEFIKDYANHLNVNKVLDANGFTTNNLTYLREGIVNTAFHQHLHGSDHLLKAISYESASDVDMTPLFQEFLDVYQRIESEVELNGHMKFGAHLVNEDVIDGFFDLISFFAQANLTRISVGFVKENLAMLFDPLLVYLTSDDFSIEFITSVVDIKEEYSSRDVINIIDSYKENDHDRLILTEEKELELTNIVKHLLDHETAELVK